jgi:hypothetical protein
MGTRADFYIGSGNEAEWLGSVAWDGYQWASEGTLIDAKTEDIFRLEVEKIKSERDDFTHPDMGWPWPWDDSNTTDYAYMFDGDKVRVFAFGGEQFINDDGEIDYQDGKFDGFPDMSSRKNVAFGNRSGIIVIGC